MKDQLLLIITYTIIFSLLKAIVRCIGATRLTLPHVIKRTLDIDENVRKVAYKFIADKVHIRSLTIAKREEIIRRGLNDRNENVRNVVSKDLVPSWLRFCNESIVELLYALGKFYFNI